MSTSILVVDANSAQCTFMKDVLRSTDSTVQTALNVRQALRSCARESFDLVITEMLMPTQDENGVDLILGLKEMPFRGQIIAMSGGHRMISAQFALHSARLLGVLRTITKPFSAAALLQNVDIALMRKTRQTA